MRNLKRLILIAIWQERCFNTNIPKEMKVPVAFRNLRKTDSSDYWRNNIFLYLTKDEVTR